MTSPVPFALYCSWPLWEQRQRFDLGWLHDGPAALPTSEVGPRDVDHRALGVWRCDLTSGRLDWSSQVHRLFGIPQDHVIRRNDALEVYTEESRAALERLRTHALRHRRGFTLDVALRPCGERPRWMRINAAPRVADRRPVELYGTKQDVTAAYR